MDMTSKEIVTALGKLEMSGGMNLVSVELCAAIVQALAPKDSAKKTEPPKIKGRQPE